MAGRIGSVTKAADVTMVPSSSAQREPSMEEILASIRRIIEDNDAGRGPSPETDAALADDDADERNVIEVNAFRNELRGTADDVLSASPTARVDAPGQDNVRDEAAARRAESAEEEAQAARAGDERKAASDRLAAEERIRMAIDNARARSAEMKRQDEAEQQLRSEPVQADASETLKSEAATAESPQATASADREAAGPAPAEAQQATAGAGTETAQAQPAAAPRPEAASQLPSITRTGGVEAAQARTAFLSEQAERKIQASFGELSEAFAARSQKTFDDMAEEMLQPMLRDWLDNNLPVLVERLVREEIERVARGSQ